MEPVSNPSVPMPQISQGTTICSFCGATIPENSIFCPICGKQLMEKPLSTTLWSQIWIYGMSVLLPPLGLWPGIKYMKSSNPKAKQMGIIAVVLTIASTIITTWVTYAILQSYISQVNSVLSGTNITPGEATGIPGL